MKDTGREAFVPWGWLTAIGLLGAHVIIQVVLTVVGLGLLGLALMMTSRLNQNTLTALATSGVFLGAIGTFAGLMSLALIYVVVTGLRKRPFRATIRLTGNRHVWRAVFGAVILGGVMDTVTLVLHKPIVPDALGSTFMGATSAAAMTLFAIIVTPLAEELLFRGALYPVAARSLGVTGGVTFVSLLFGLAHVATYGLDVYLITQALVAGLYFTWLRARTGSLVPALAAHTAMNLYATMEAIVVVNLLR